MSTHPTDTHDLNVMVESLRGQLLKSQGENSANRRRKPRPDPQLAELENQVTALLDMLEQRAALGADGEVPPAPPRNSQQPPAADLASTGAELATQVAETLERSLAQWQAQIMLAYSQAATQELGEQLRATIQLSETLQQRETRLESQRQALEKLSADVLQQQARTQRQRHSLAQALRAQKAEMLLDLQRQRQEWTQQIQQQQLIESHQQAAVDSQQSADIARLQLELQAAQAELASAQHETASAQDELASAQDELASARQDWQSSLAEWEGSRVDTQGLQTSLDETQKELKQAYGELESVQQNLLETSQLLAELEHSQPEPSIPPDHMQASLARLAELENRLTAADQEIQDLKQQNFDLASQVAKHQVVSSGHIPHVSFDSTTLSWEERKKLIMRQLEEDSLHDEDAQQPEQAARRLEIEDIVQATQLEVERRDAEIAELHAIIEQQSDTRQGVAIGAAAFAQAFESDEIIQQERQRLKEMQAQWEQKLRQAEIDVSLERARLARERTQLEQELEDTQREKAALVSDPSQSKKRKWLEHLGLREESRGDS